MTDNVSIRKEKTAVYELFARIFAKEADKNFLKLLKEPGNEGLIKSCGIVPLSDIKDLSLKEQEEKLAVEYARLFIVPGAPSSPRESIMRGEGKLWGQTTAVVNKIYEAFGFVLDDNFKDMPDHLSAELSFLAELCKLEVKYSTKKLEKAKTGVRTVKRYFLENHLLKWYKKFKDSIAVAAKLKYYKEFSTLLDKILDMELKEV